MVVEYAPSQFPKQCGCGRRYDRQQWEGLFFRHFWPGTDDQTGRRFGPDLESRDCHCKSTISVAVLNFDQITGGRGNG